MSRIIILTEIFFPIETSTGYLLTKIATGLTQRYAITVVTGKPDEIDAISEKGGGDYLEGVEIIRCAQVSFKSQGLAQRLIQSALSATSILWKVLQVCCQDDVLLVVTNPPLLPFSALIVKLLKRCRYVLLVHDVYPDALSVMNIIKPSSLVYKIWENLNRKLYKYASQIIVLGRDMSKLLQDKGYTDELKVCLIHNWADIETISPQLKSNNILIKEYSLANKFVFLYAGNMGRTHGIETLAEVVNILKHKQSLHFIFIGFGAKKSWLEDYKSKHQLNNVSIFSMTRPRSEQVISLNACDVAVIAFSPGMSGISVPSRMYNHMAAGRPIIALADRSSELAMVIEEEKIGWVVPPNDFERLLAVIEFAQAHPEICAAMGARASSAVKKKYTLNHALVRYSQLFEKLFSVYR